MNKRLLSSTLRAVSMTAVAVLLTSAAVAQGQTAGSSQPQRPTMVDEKQAAAMMAEREKMMANMRALDQKLNDLVAKINTVHGEAKVDAIAAVVRELVAQRTQMRSQMEGMQAQMMDHMMQHMMSMQGSMMGMMQGRGQTSAMQSMSDCPMMKELSKEAAEGDHSAHHPEK